MEWQSGFVVNCEEKSLVQTIDVLEYGSVPEFHSGTQKITDSELSFRMNRDSTFGLMMDE